MNIMGHQIFVGDPATDPNNVKVQCCHYPTDLGWNLSMSCAFGLKKYFIASPRDLESKGQRSRKFSQECLLLGDFFVSQISSTSYGTLPSLLHVPCVLPASKHRSMDW